MMRDESLKSWRVLLVDDDEDDFHLTRVMLKTAEGRKITLDWAPTFSEGQVMLQSHDYDAALVDYDLGARTGIEFIRQSTEHGYPTPLILYTGRGTRQVDLEAMEAGASLYLTKEEANPLLLERFIRYAIERKQAEKELRQSQKQLSRLVNTSFEGIWSVDQEGITTFVNERAAEILGYTVEEIRGHTAFDFLMPADVEAGRQTFARIARGESGVVEAHARKKNGKEAWLQVSFSPILDETGGFQGALAMFNDISESKLSGEAVQHHRQLLETVIQNIPVAVNLIRGSDLRIVMINPAYQAIAPGKEMVGKTLDELWPETGRVFGDLCQQVLETGVPFQAVDDLVMISRSEDSTPEPAYFTWSLSRVDLPGEERVGILNITWETTGRKQAEEALRESEGRFRAMADGTPMFIWVTDPEGTIEFINQAYCDFFGVTAEQVHSQGWQPLVHPDDQAYYVGTFMECLHQRKEFNAETRVRQKNGEWRWVVSHAKPRFSQSGEFLGMAGSSFDNTDRKRAEEAIQAYTEQLQRSNQALQDFAFMASHDLREPLRKIMGFGDQLATSSESALNEQERDYIERMQQASKRMMSMLDGLLSYSRVTMQGNPFERADLNKEAQDVLSDFDTSLKDAGGKVELGELPVIQADRTQMRQLLQNLIGNAIKFHQPGKPPLVKVYSRPAGINAYELVVEDNGIGFDESSADQIFKPFHRLVGRSAYDGTGMGLAICQKIVERHEGSITAKGTPGGGATFIVTLPCRKIPG